MWTECFDWPLECVWVTSSESAVKTASLCSASSPSLWCAGISAGLSASSHTTLTHSALLTLPTAGLVCALKWWLFAPVRCSTAPGRGNTIQKNTAIKSFNFRGPRRLLDQGPSKQSSAFQHRGRRQINNMILTARQTFCGKTQQV